MSAKATDQPVTDDQELAKVLANNTAQQKNDASAATDEALSGLQFEESPVPAQKGAQPASASQATEQPSDTSTQQSSSTLPSITPSPSAAAAASNTQATTPTPASTPSTTPSPAPTQAPTPAPASSTAGGGGLENIKKDALEELRPLVDKLDLPAEEKFDTLLLIIRSTDDQSLLEPAHEAAKSITDESRRAQALLDIIKEIDFFSAQGQA